MLRDINIVGIYEEVQCVFPSRILSLVEHQEQLHYIHPKHVSTKQEINTIDFSKKKNIYLNDWTIYI